MSDLLDAALAYAARGWHVFPLLPKDKVPKAGSAGHLDATTDEAQIRAWWPPGGVANIGIACGASGLAVVDVDPDGEASLEDLPDLPETSCVVTGRGTHHYFATAEVVRSIIGWRPNVDLKAAGGYVVAPPSVHESGVAYAWDEPDECPGHVADLPEWIAAERRVVSVAAQIDAGKAAGDWTPGLRGGLASALMHVNADDYDRWVAIGAALHLASGGCAEGFDLWDEWSRRSPRYEDGATGKRWGSFKHATGNPATVGKIVALAREGGWKGSLPLSSEYKAKVAEAKAERTQTLEASGRYFKRGDEQEVAQAVAAIMAAPMVYDRGSLWRYSAKTGRWSEIISTEVERRVGELAGEPVRGGLDKDGQVKWGILKVGQNTRTNVRKIICSEKHRRGFFDEAPAGVAFADGFLRFRGGKVVLEKHSPSHRVRAGYDFTWSGDHRCPRWLDAQRQWFGDIDDRALLLQEFAGACLFGLATTYQAALVLYGEAGAGKSQCASVIEGMFPAETVTAVPPQLMDDLYFRAELAGSLLNVVNDIPEAGIMDAGAFKAIVSGDHITARPIREAPFRFRPRAGHLFSANSLPSTKDHTDGFWRRWLLVVFDRVVALDAQVKDLATSILSEEMPGVVLWAVRGAIRLVERGHYLQAGQSADALSEWRRDSNHVAEWAHECVIRGAGFMLTEDARAVFNRWAIARGYTPLNVQTVGKRLHALGFTKDRHPISRRKGYVMKLDTGFGAEKSDPLA